MTTLTQTKMLLIQKEEEKKFQYNVNRTCLISFYTSNCPFEKLIINVNFAVFPLSVCV